mmetsp:Transcript_32749/g.29033  ORF Transcript_32749/g.29033 Transcript_32749/m.29033 type:complete len:280 (+) Transcript_32749:1708-2547(+)
MNQLNSNQGKENMNTLINDGLPKKLERSQNNDDKNDFLTSRLPTMESLHPPQLETSYEDENMKDYISQLLFMNQKQQEIYPNPFISQHLTREQELCLKLHVMRDMYTEMIKKVANEQQAQQPQQAPKPKLDSQEKLIETIGLNNLGFLDYNTTLSVIQNDLVSSFRDLLQSSKPAILSNLLNSVNSSYRLQTLAPVSCLRPRSDSKRKNTDPVSSDTIESDINGHLNNVAPLSSVQKPGAFQKPFSTFHRDPKKRTQSMSAFIEKQDSQIWDPREEKKQ